MHQTGKLLAYRLLLLRPREQQEKTAAARAQQLAADRAHAARGLVELVDLGGRYPVGKPALVHPALVQEPAEFLDRRRRRLQHADGFVHQRPHVLQLVLALVHVVDLGLGDFGGDAGKPGEAQHQVALQRGQPLDRQHDRGHVEGAVLAEGDAIEAAKRRGHLVLRADVLADDFLLDVDRLARQLFLGYVLAAQRVDGVDESDGERGARAQAGAGGQVAVVVDFQSVLAIVDAQHRFHRRVLDLGDVDDVFDAGIDDAVLVLEELRQVAAVDVAVLVDRGREHRAAVAPHPGRVIGAAAEERDAKGSAGDDHRATTR